MIKKVKYFDQLSGDIGLIHSGFYGSVRMIESLVSGKKELDLTSKCSERGTADDGHRSKDKRLFANPRQPDVDF